MGGWLAAARVYLEPRVLAVLCLGFASGLPLLLTLSTLTFWLAEADVDKAAIGLFALVGLPYTWKFLWAPIVDRVSLPVFTALLGRRRGWLLFVQILLAAAIVALGACDPQHDLGADGGAGRTRGVPVRQPGHRHRCLSGRAAGRAAAGCGCSGGRDWLPRRHAPGRCGRADHRGIRQLVLGLRRDGPVPGGRGSHGVADTRAGGGIGPREPETGRRGSVPGCRTS